MYSSSSRAVTRRRVTRQPYRKRQRYGYASYGRVYNPQRLLRAAFTQAHELKTIDITVNQLSGVISTGLGFFYLSPVVQGTAATNRTGRKIVVERIEVKIYGELSAANTGIGDIARVAVIMDNETNGTAPTSAAIITANTYIGYHYNPDNFSRFKILWDSQQHSIPQTNAGSGGTNYWAINKVIRCKHVVHYFNALNNGNVGDCEKNSLYLTYGCEGGTVTFQGFVRLYFRDV